MVIKSAKNHLQIIKDNIYDSYRWFKPNFDSFNLMKKFVFCSSLSAAEKSLLASKGFPTLEFNILESRVSKIRTEFSQQEPSLTVHAIADAQRIDPEMIKIVEGHIRAIMQDSNQYGLNLDIFTDQLAGGFSVAKVYTDYVSPKSFHQGIYIRRAYDPTMCIFDKMAVQPHKGDGRFCAELYPKTEDEVRELYGSDAVKKIQLSSCSSLGDLQWAYKDASGEKIILLAEYFEKKREKVKMLQLVTGEAIEEKEYEKYAEWWNNNFLMQAPAVISSKKDHIDTICRYVVCQDEVLEYAETDYKYLPQVFIDGNSQMLKDTTNGAAFQMTRPYVYQAVGVQRLKNLAGNTLGNELENMTQSKMKVAKEGIPEEYKDAYIYPQIASTYIYNAFMNDDPNVPLPPPDIVPRVPAPPEVMGAFTITDEMTRTILGSYDSDLNASSRMVSGEAIQQGVLQSNLTAGPYLVSYINGLNRLGAIVLDLIPKYLVEKRSISHKGFNNKRTYVEVNGTDSPSMDYDSDQLEIRVEAGVNFEVQRSRDFEMLNRLMQTSPWLNEFISGEAEGVEMILDNVNIRGIDALKQKMPEFIAKKKEMAEKQQQMAMQQQQMQMEMMQQNNPMQAKQAELQMKQAELKQKDMQMQIDALDKEVKNDIAQQKVDIERAKTAEELQLERESNFVRAAEVSAHNLRSETDLAIKELDSHRKHAVEMLTIHQNASKNETTVSVNT